MLIVNLLSRELISLGAQAPQLPTAAGIFERAWSILVSVLSSGQYVSPYWSASPNANNSNNAWQLNFNNGNDNNNNRNNNNHVRLVRVGQWYSWERLGAPTCSRLMAWERRVVLGIEASLRAAAWRLPRLAGCFVVRIGLSPLYYAN